jgi:hypothetical protein
MEGIASPMVTVASLITAVAAVCCASELAMIICNQRRTRRVLRESPVGQAYQLGYATGKADTEHHRERKSARHRARDRWADGTTEGGET